MYKADFFKNLLNCLRQRRDVTFVPPALHRPVMFILSRACLSAKGSTVFTSWWFGAGQWTEGL